MKVPEVSPEEVYSDHPKILPPFKRTVVDKSITLIHNMNAEKNSDDL